MKNTQNIAPKKRIVGLKIAFALLLLFFAKPLIQLIGFVYASEFNSYIILIPFICGYLIWIKKVTVHLPSNPNRVLASIFFIAGLCALLSYWALVLWGLRLEREDSLSLLILSFVALLWGICVWNVPIVALSPIVFPLGMLILMVPFPIFFRGWVETALQHGSAIAALGMFRLSGTPVFYSDLNFQLSDITLRVAPECSGIQSTVALLITSLVAGYLFLHSKWRRCALTLAVLPLAILRNGFRVFTIGELCVHIGPEMIDSPIHHKGGPIFFALSLIPFLLFLFFLIKFDKPGGSQRLNIT